MAKIDFEKINDMALLRFSELMGAWLPQGRLQGSEYVALNPKRNDRNLGSFRININGKWHDFATGDKGGDLVSLFAYLNDLSQSVAAKKMSENFGVTATQNNKKPWQKIWDEAAPLTEKNSVYLKNRGLNFSKDLEIRFNQKLYYGPNEFYPALVFPVRNIRNSLVAVHRIYLNPESHNKADVSSPKKLLGSIKGAAIKFGANDSEAIAIAEGPETALAVHESTGLTTWSVISASNMTNIQLQKKIKTVHIFADSDENKVGFEAANKLAQQLLVQGVIPYIHLPNRNDFEDPKSVDWLDVYNKFGEVPLLKSLKDVTPVKSERQILNVGAFPIDEVASKAEQILIEQGAQIYVRGSKLVRPVVELTEASGGRTTTCARLVELTLDSLRDHFSKYILFTKFDARSKENLVIDPPKLVASILLSRDGFWKFPKLTGVITSPTMRPDGSIFSDPGYDQNTKLLLLSPPKINVPENPTKEDAFKELKKIKSLLREFPFENKVGMSVALSALLTTVARGAMQVAPIHVIRAYDKGSGKSYLIDLISALTAGRPAPAIEAGDSREEMDKRLAAALIGGQPIISIDNLNGVLGGNFLCQAVERPIIEIRPLGVSQIVRVENKTTIFANGNNILIKGDMIRRSLLVVLDSNEERCEFRVFKNNPLEEILNNRGLYLSSALTILKAYVAAGLPVNLPALNSFGQWSNLIRASLVWLDLPDPAKSMDEVRDEDPDTSKLKEVITAWKNCIGLEKSLTVGEVSNFCGSPCGEAHDLYVALVNCVSGKDGRPDFRRLGYWLRENKGRVVDGLKFVGARNGSNQNTWKLISKNVRASGDQAIMEIGSCSSHTVVNSPVTIINQLTPARAQRKSSPKCPASPEYKSKIYAPDSKEHVFFEDYQKELWEGHVQDE